MLICSAQSATSANVQGDQMPQCPDCVGPATRIQTIGSDHISEMLARQCHVIHHMCPCHILVRTALLCVLRFVCESLEISLSANVSMSNPYHAVLVDSLSWMTHTCQTCLEMWYIDHLCCLAGLCCQCATSNMQWLSVIPIWCCWCMLICADDTHTSQHNMICMHMWNLQCHDHMCLSMCVSDLIVLVSHTKPSKCLVWCPTHAASIKHMWCSHYTLYTLINTCISDWFDNVVVWCRSAHTLWF